MTRFSRYKRGTLGCLLAAGLVAGCAGNGGVNIGDGEVAVDKDALESYAGDWSGYVEAYTFPSGTDKIRVVLDEQGSGSLQIGEGDLAAPPTDPDVGYPPSLVALAPETALLIMSNLAVENLHEGIAYPIANATLASQRLRFQFDALSAYTDWCELQSAYPQPTSPPSYGCIPGGGINESAEGVCSVQMSAESDEQVPVDCVKAFECMFVCACDATSCTNMSGTPMLVDAALSDDGQHLDGTILLYNDESRTVRLERTDSES